ncbi:MAG: phosphatidylglycerol lysyltransferase domain-containing protein [Clostridiales bacterium]|nr:phosphatidylglycerol lysyltransferase domain-containing protein [Clostridiales bacterium]
MINFRAIELSDREWIEAILKKANLMGCEYTFVNNYIWGTQYQLEIANVNGFYCTRSGMEEVIYGFPIGEGNLAEVIRLLEEDAKERNVPFVMKGMLAEHVTLLDLICPGEFEITTSRDDSDYIYSVEKLSKLSGKKLHGKRNHIARFKDNEDWQYEKLTEENMKDCLEMNRKWCENNNCLDNISLKHEACAVKKAFRHFKALNLVGGLLRLNGEVVAYTIGEPLSDNTFVIHIEKAFSEIQGAYPMINQQFVLHECQDYEYVNREEDLGEEGLRKAKLSYYPEILLDKYKATKRG